MSFPILAALLSTLPAAAVDEEWTLDAARDCWLSMVRPVQHVGVPGYQFQAGVMWDGALVFGPLDFRGLKVMQEETGPLGDSLLHVSVGFGDPMRLIDRKGTASKLIRRSLDEGRLPIPTVLTEDGELLWRETVFAHLLGRALEEGMSPRPDDVLAVHALFSVRNRARWPVTGHLWLHLGDTSRVQFGYKCVQKDGLAPSIPHRLEPPLGLVGDRARYVLPPPAKGKKSHTMK